MTAVVLSMLLWTAQSPMAAEFGFQPNGKGIKAALRDGKIKEALAYYESRASAAEKAAAARAEPTNWRKASRFYSAASHAARYSGDFQKALGHGNKALQIARRIEAADLELLALSKLSGIYGLMRDSDSLGATINLAQATLETMPATHDRRLHYKALFGYYQGTYHVSRKEFDQAIDSFSTSLSDSRKMLSTLPKKQGNGAQVHGFREMIIRLHLTMGDVYLRKKDLRAALDQYRRASRLLEEWKLRTHVDRHLHSSLAATHELLDNDTEALKHYRQALDLLSRRDRPERAADIHTKIAQIHESREEHAEALEHYQAAVRVVESTRALLELQHRHSYFRRKLRPYSGITRTLLETGAVEEAFEYVERARARDFLDLLGNRVRPIRIGADSELADANELLSQRLDRLHAKLAARGNRLALRIEIEEAESAYEEFARKARAEDEELASITMINPSKLTEVQALLPPKTTLLEYFVDETRLFVWVVTKTRVHFHEVRISREELRSLVEDLRGKIAGRDPVDAISTLSRRLDETLFRPVRSHIRTEDLIIVPHDSLHYLPFQVLRGPDGKYLVQDFAVRYLPSASVLKFTARKKKPSARRILAVGNPRIDNRNEELRFAQAEAEMIGRLFDDTTVLLGNEATEAEIKRIAPQFDILHFATHGEFNQKDILSSALLLAKSNDNDGRLEVKEIFEMQLTADLVVLSACQTGLGKRSRGDELIGLTRAFIYAGTPSVIASLWKIEDSATARLMASFYSHFQQTSKTEALRQAQIQLIRDGAKGNLVATRGIGGIAGQEEDPPPEPGPLPTSHPYFWAPFVLVGEGA